MIKSILFIVILIASSSSFSSDFLRPLAQVSGPFNGTKISKYADYGDGVACYIYHAERVDSKQYFEPGSGVRSERIDPSQIGSISCAKVAEPQKRPQGK